jgi:flagellar protein FlaI
MIGKKFLDDLVRGYKILSSGKIEESPVPVEIVGQPPIPLAAVKKREEETFESLEEQAEKRGAKIVEAKGIEIPEFKPRQVRLAKIEPEEEKTIRITYPLIPARPKKGEPVFAYVMIFWDERANKYVYQLVEPELSLKLREILDKIKDLLEQRLDVDFSKLKKFEAMGYLTKQVNELIDYFGFRINETEKRILRYYIERDFVGLGKIEPIIRDDNIEDISCDGVGIPLFVFHRNSKLGSMATNMTYNDENELDSFVTRLSQLCGRTISVADPLIDGSLPDGSRLQATLATDIARRGSNFTIRKFTKTPLTPVHLLNYNTLDVKMMAYLWFITDHGASVIVSGGTASGKTSLLNVLSLFIRQDKKIVSIEDTAELRLPHPHWVPTVARSPMSEEGELKRGEVDLFDLLRESFRQRPDYIIVGEVRGREAYILFQQMATGHPSLSTIHAENMPKLIDRLTTPPISLPPGLMGSMDLIVFLARMNYKGNFVRRANEIIEMIEYDAEKKRPVINKVFKWNPENDKFTSDKKSIILKKIAERTGMKDKEIEDELERRMMVLSWMKENNILDFRNVNKVINMYYNYPQRTISMVMERM